MDKILPQRMQNVGAWAERQVNRAVMFIRTASMSITGGEEDEGTEINQVQASDGYFFEQFIQTPTVEEDSTANDGQLTIVRLTINENQQALDNLYVEALYTIVHKVGNTTCIPEHQLIEYVKTAFQIEDSRHLKLIDRARKEKPPVVLLNVHLLEARDLIAKDINGFSDPFTMMGVIPGRRRKESRTRNSSGDKTPPEDPSIDGQPSSPSAVSKTSIVTAPARPPSSTRRASLTQAVQKHAGVLHRFGEENWVRKKGTTSEMKGIPAKLIKASSVQRKTLFPKWNEKFQFIVEDVATDRFHLDIWDHDDEESSVLDAVTSLNQISGLKGLGRYFKEVTQSARADSDDLLDDFLGSVNLRIKDIPSTGTEEWFTLEKRSEKSEVSGQVLLRLWLSTKEERINDQEDDLLDVKQHIELIRQFALQEIRFSGAPVSFYHGDLPETAKMILHQHAVQGDLTEVHQNMCKQRLLGKIQYNSIGQWLAYSAMTNISISYAFLYEILQNLIAKWVPLALDKEEENMLADSFQRFDEHCHEQLLKHRTNINVEKRVQLEFFGDMIRCLKLMRNSAIYQKTMPAARYFEQDIVDCLTKSAVNYFNERLKKVENPSNACEELYNLLLGLNAACAKSTHFEPIFRSNADVEYAVPMYQVFDRMLYEYIAAELMNEKQFGLKISMLNAPDEESSLTSMLKIHLELSDFRRFRSSKIKYKMDTIEWDPMFDRAIAKWFDLARVKGFARVDLACQLDAQVQISSNEFRHTSSYIDVCHIIDQIMTTWERMAVKDVYTQVDLTEKIVQTVCKIAEYYVDRIMAQLAADGFCGQLNPVLPPALVNIFCAVINNAEQVRRTLSISEKLNLDELCDSFTKITKQKGGWRANVERELETCERYIGEQIDCTVERMVQRQVPQMKKHVFHLAWSPGACPVDQSLKPLTDMLDTELSSIHRNLLHRNFIRIMHGQVNVLVRLLQDCVNENPGLEPPFYMRLSEAWNVLVEFFHAGGKGISMEAFASMPSHRALVSQLTLNQLSTVKLIEQYYMDLLKTQSEVSECKYGILNVRAYYNSNSQTLNMDVIGAKQVIPLDSNGLSDPFVVIEVVPRIRFPLLSTAKTKVVSKCLNPIFDETFEFHIAPKLPPCALVHFVVMDHDMFRSNDFAGEAFLDLTEVPGFGTAGVSNTLRQFNLVLIHSSNKDHNALEVLDSRKEDKDAQEFMRSLRTSY
ncbi:Protein unc-13-like protein D [Aphelenchoides besseyi]|nr:Protein unc-13-like protein D [Aphelenchoides besseyi]